MSYEIGERIGNDIVLRFNVEPLIERRGLLVSSDAVDADGTVHWPAVLDEADWHVRNASKNKPGNFSGYPAWAADVYRSAKYHATLEGYEIGS